MKTKSVATPSLRPVWDWGFIQTICTVFQLNKLNIQQRYVSQRSQAGYKQNYHQAVDTKFEASWI